MIAILYKLDLLRSKAGPHFSRLIYFQPWCDQKLLTWQKSILKMSVTSALRNRSYRWRGIVKQRSLNCRYPNGLNIIYKSTPTLKTGLISQPVKSTLNGVHFKFDGNFCDQNTGTVPKKKKKCKSPSFLFAHEWRVTRVAAWLFIHGWLILRREYHAVSEKSRNLVLGFTFCPNWEKGS